MDEKPPTIKTSHGKMIAGKTIYSFNHFAQNYFALKVKV